MVTIWQCISKIIQFPRFMKKNSSPCLSLTLVSPSLASVISTLLLSVLVSLFERESNLWGRETLIAAWGKCYKCLHKQLNSKCDQKLWCEILRCQWGVSCTWHCSSSSWPPLPPSVLCWGSLRLPGCRRRWPRRRSAGCLVMWLKDRALTNTMNIK